MTRIDDVMEKYAKRKADTHRNVIVGCVIFGCFILFVIWLIGYVL